MDPIKVDNIPKKKKRIIPAGDPNDENQFETPAPIINDNDNNIGKKKKKRMIKNSGTPDIIQQVFKETFQTPAVETREDKRRKLREAIKRGRGIHPPEGLQKADAKQQLDNLFNQIGIIDPQQRQNIINSVKSRNGSTIDLIQKLAI